MSLSFARAHEMVTAAHEHAGQLGIAISCVVVDEGGAIRAAGRMDDASVVSFSAAEAKAMNCAVGRRDAAAYVALQATPASLAFLERILPRPISPGLGGVVIRHGAAYLGAIGVSGGTGAQDHECASAAIAKVVDR